jgi:alkylation response protein AidB-like acyl-CoA dehydrogenase
MLTRDDLASWTALGLTLTSADLVGLMRGVLDSTVAYASDRRQFGVPVGSFQAVQHLLAEARCLMEGSISVALHASWAVDNLGPEDARAAGRVAKAYCARAARTVCETAVQVHGGMGNTWDCIVHVYLRRALLSAQWFGDDGEQLRQLQRHRLGVAHGLS